MSVTRLRVAGPAAFLRGRPDASAEVLTELLHGEDVAVSFSRADWAEVENLTDGYKGFIPTAALGAAGTETTHCVRALSSFVFPEPNLKTPPISRLSFLARTRPIGERNGFAELAEGGWISVGHLAPHDTIEPSYWLTAQRFLEVPYLWGGRTSFGLDCSALVQLSLAAAGIAAPRDSGPQRTGLGQRVLGDATPRPGDFAFWPGHVGIVGEGGLLIHANAHHMMVAAEPLTVAQARIGPAEIRRI